MVLAKSNTNFKEDHHRNIPPKFGKIQTSSFRGVDENVKFHKGSNVKLCWAMAAILNGARQDPTQILKRTIIGTFHQCLVKICQAVSEELMKM